ncbi:MAG: hypothetical protein JWN46_2373 [Acidimicrobiales bacterium]|nr:hypothetical protein [Acidimicrobiales bacterium]
MKELCRGFVPPYPQRWHQSTPLSVLTLTGSSLLTAAPALTFLTPIRSSSSQSGHTTAGVESAGHGETVGEVEVDRVVPPPAPGTSRLEIVVGPVAALGHRGARSTRKGPAAAGLCRVMASARDRRAGTGSPAPREQRRAPHRPPGAAAKPWPAGPAARVPGCATEGTSGGGRRQAEHDRSQLVRGPAGVLGRRHLRWGAARRLPHGSAPATNRTTMTSTRAGPVGGLDGLTSLA